MPPVCLFEDLMTTTYPEIRSAGDSPHQPVPRRVRRTRSKADRIYRGSVRGAGIGSLVLLVLVGLFLFKGSYNLYSVIGFVALVGLIAKHGILIVEFTNRLREQGRDLHDALIEASALRLRPIVMTTTATVLGALPLVLATGSGAGGRAQIGIVIAVGMSFGTLVSLFVLPAVYSLAASRRRRAITPVPGGVGPLTIAMLMANTVRAARLRRGLPV